MSEKTENKGSIIKEISIRESEIKNENGLTIERININTDIKQPSTVFTDLKKGLGLDGYSDNSFILYILIFSFFLQKLIDLFGFIKNLITLPKQFADTYSFITKKDIELIDKIDDLLNQILGLTGADRVIIGKIHNGTYDNVGTHEIKFSAVYEVTRNNVKHIKSTIQNIPIKHIKAEISQGSFKEFIRIERSAANSSCDMFLDKLGIAVKNYRLLSINSVIYGIIDIHWMSIPDFEYQKDVKIKKRFDILYNELESCLQAVFLKRTWLQSLFDKSSHN